MRWILVATLFSLVGCQSAAQGQAVNNWLTQHLSHDSGCHATAIIDYYDDVDGEWKQIVKQGTGKDNYQVYAGKYAIAEAEVDAENWADVDCWASVSMADVDPEWHKISVMTARRHKSETMLPLIDTTGVTYFDVHAVAQFEADRDGLAWGRMSFHKPFPPPMETGGPPPVICDGMAIRGNLHSSHVEYTFNAGLWLWERTGEIVHYDAVAGHNVTDELPPMVFPGLRGLTYQQFLFPFQVSESEWVELYADVNGEGWEFGYQTITEQSGTFTKSRDTWHVNIELQKEIEDLP